VGHIREEAGIDVGIAVIYTDVVVRENHNVLDIEVLDTGASKCVLQQRDFLVHLLADVLVKSHRSSDAAVVATLIDVDVPAGILHLDDEDGFVGDDDTVKLGSVFAVAELDILEDSLLASDGIDAPKSFALSCISGELGLNQVADILAVHQNPSKKIVCHMTAIYVHLLKVAFDIPNSEATDLGMGIIENEVDELLLEIQQFREHFFTMIGILAASGDLGSDLIDTVDIGLSHIWILLAYVFGGLFLLTTSYQCVARKSTYLIQLATGQRMLQQTVSISFVKQQMQQLSNKCYTRDLRSNFLEI